MARTRIPDLLEAGLRRILRRGAASPTAPRYNVLCLPVIEWGFRFQRPQQLMRQFARHGHRVFYAALRFHASGGARARKIEPNVLELELPADCAVDVYRDALEAPRCQEMAAAVRRSWEEHGSGPTVVVVQLPFWAPLAEELRRSLGWPIVYDCMDDHSGFSTNGPGMLAAEDRLIESADLVLASSEPLFLKIQPRARRSLVLRNACEFEHFRAAVSSNRPRGHKRLIGYYGAIADWFDAGLVADLAKSRPEWRFQLVGSTFTADIRPLEPLANVELLGERSYEDLPALISRWDCCIIPFKRLPLTEATNPVKVYEMLAAGKPVVSVDLPELRPLAAQGLVRLAEDPGGFSRAISAASDQDAREAVARRIDFARRNTWKDRFMVLKAEIDALRAAQRGWRAAHLCEAARAWRRFDAGFLKRPLAEIVERARAGKGAVIFLPSIGWDIDLPQRPHHMARALARQGYTCVFDCSNANDAFQGFKEAEPNLHLFRGPEDLLYEIPDPVLWAFPYNFHRKDGYPANVRTVYDWIDDLSVFPHEREFLRRNHRRGLAEADLFLSVTAGLHAQAARDRADAVYLPNGVEYARFAAAPPAAEPDCALARLLGEGKPIAGYYGALSRWFDYRLLEAVARLRPDWNFLLIGPMYDETLKESPLLSLRNVAWIGPRPYAALPACLRAFDVALIPFVIDDITAATSPLKLFEYFAGAKPVIATPMPQCRGFEEVLIAGGPGEFSKALDLGRSLGQDPEFRERLRARARENSWDVRCRDALTRLPPPEAARRAKTAAASPRGAELRAYEAVPRHFDRFDETPFFLGLCNVCGLRTAFFAARESIFQGIYRGSLTCAECLAVNRCRSIARGILRAAKELAGAEAESLAGLSLLNPEKRLAIYDTQAPYRYDKTSYPIPDMLSRCGWIDLETSVCRPTEPPGARLGTNITNQNLEALTFRDESFDIVLTSDIMGYVRRDDRAHREIRRILKPGGVYLFTVPHFRDRHPNLAQAPETDGQADGSLSTLYRFYGTSLDGALKGLGLEVDYSNEDFRHSGIMNIELFYCRLGSDAKTPADAGVGGMRTP